MKKIIFTMMASLLVCSVGYSQENNVVLDYDQITIGYMHHSIDTEMGDVSTNGVGISASQRFSQPDFSNFVVSAGLGSSWIENLDASVFQIGVGLGYILTLSDTLHLVPSVSIDYERIHDYEYYYGDTWVFTPSISLNYAVAESLELSLGLAYSDPFNTEILGEGVSHYTEGSFAGSVGAEYAINNNLGLVSRVTFIEDQTAFAVGLSWHF